MKVGSEMLQGSLSWMQPAAEPPCVCGRLWRIVRSFISSNWMSFTSCSLRLHENRIRSCELPQPIDPAPKTWIVLLWGSPASQTGFNHALSPNHGNLIYLKPLAVGIEPLQFVLGIFCFSPHHPISELNSSGCWSCKSPPQLTYLGNICMYFSLSLFKLKKGETLLG